jgi:hypothetical protein
MTRKSDSGVEAGLGLACPSCGVLSTPDPEALRAVVLDANSPKGTVLDPIHLSIGLERDTGDGRTSVIEMDPEEFLNIHWISVLADDR